MYDLILYWNLGHCFSGEVSQSRRSMLGIVKKIMSRIPCPTAFRIKQSEFERIKFAEDQRLCWSLCQWPFLICWAAPSPLYTPCRALLSSIDNNPSTLTSGKADGLQLRTLEVLSSLGLVNEVLT